LLALPEWNGRLLARLNGSRRNLFHACKWSVTRHNGGQVEALRFNESVDL
jgi:hypothetical protein